MEKEKEIKANELSIQSIVDFIGRDIVKNKTLDRVPASKAIGEVEIDNVLYQIQVTLEPKKTKWIEENGVIRNFKKSTSCKQKILGLFKYTTDAETQK